MISAVQSPRPAQKPSEVAAPAARPQTPLAQSSDVFQSAPAAAANTLPASGAQVARSADPSALWGAREQATYTVQPGDTLYGIAGKLGVGFQALMTANPQLTDPNLLQVGQVLNVPGASPVEPPPPAGPQVAPELAAAHRQFEPQLGAPTGEPVREAGGNLKQEFERGYLLRAPDGTVFARGLDNTELGTVAPVTPAGGDVDEAALQWVNKTRPVSPAGYAPADLVSVDRDGNLAPGSGFQVRAIAQGPLRDMISAAAAEGLNLDVISAFRSFQTQESVYANWVSQLGQEQADRVSARPGHSEHQLGTTVDMNVLDESFGQTPEGRWLAANGHRFGFEVSYPHGEEHVTGYAYEPWHVRFVGVELATELHQTGETLEEYFTRTRA